jgi:chromosome segregation ATPase
MNRQMRKWFLSTIVGGTLGLAALGPQALATSLPAGQIQMLRPTTGWAVSRIAANEAGSQPYCAMARKFGDNTILTFARNGKGEISVAIDFQRDALTTGQSYFTVLKPGYSQDRGFNVRPVSTKALVIRMGSDPDFFDALSRSERLGIDLNGEQYSFNMPGMQSGLHDVQDCLNTIAPRQADAGSAVEAAAIAPAAGEELLPSDQPVIAAAQPVSAVSKRSAADGQPLNQSDMTPMLAEPVAGVASAVLPSVATPDAISVADETPHFERKPDAPPVVSADSQPVAFARRPIPALADAPPVQYTDAAAPSAGELQATRQENQKLKNQLALERRNFSEQTAQQAANNGKLARMSEKIAQLEQQNDGLRHQLSTTAAEVQVAQAQAARATVNSAIVPTPVVQKPDPAIQQQLAALQNENQKLKQQAGSGILGAQQEMASLKDENLHLKQEVDSLHTQLASVATIPPAAQGDDEATIARLTTRIDQLQSENTHLTDSLGKVQLDPGAGSQETVSLAELRATEAELAVAKADRDRMQNQLDDIRTGREDKLLSMAGSNWDLKQVTARYNESQREVDRLGRQMEADKEADARKLKEAEYMLFDPRVASKQQIAKLISVESELKAAQRQLDAKDSAVADVRKSYEAKIASLQADLNTKQTMLASAQASLDAAKSQYQAKAAQSNSLEMLAMKKDLADKQAQLNVASNGAATARMDLDQQLATAKQDIASRDQELADARAELNRVETADQQKMASAQTSSQQLGQLQLASAALNQEIASRDQKLALAKQDIAARDKALADARVQLSQVQADDQQKLAAAQSGSQKLGQLETASATLNQQIISRDQQLATAQQDIAAKDRQLAQTHAELEKIQSDYQQKLATAQASTQQLGQLQTASNGLGQQLAGKDQQLADARTSIVSLQNQLTIEKTHLSQVEGQLQQVQTAQAKPAAADVDALVREKKASDQRVAILEQTNRQLQQALAQRPSALASASSVKPAVVPTTPVTAASVAMAAAAVAPGAGEDTPRPAEPSLPVIAQASAPSMPMIVKEDLSNSADSAPVALKPVPVIAVKVPEQALPAMPRTVQTASNPGFTDATAMQSILSGAGIRLNNGVRKIDAASGTDSQILSWQVGKLYGSAEQQAMNGPQQFDMLVQHYLDKTKSRCKGQFAAVPGETQDLGAVRTANYEIACIGDSGKGASASLLFYSKDNVFTTIAHESGVDGMDQAMDIRDRLLSSVTSSRIASR